MSLFNRNNGRTVAELVRRIGSAIIVDGSGISYSISCFQNRRGVYFHQFFGSDAYDAALAGARVESEKTGLKVYEFKATRYARKGLLRKRNVRIGFLEEVV